MAIESNTPPVQIDRLGETDFIGPREFVGPPAPPPIVIAIPLRWVKVSHKSADHIAARYLYAAYGSNLALGQMAHRCPMADPVGAGVLRSARLVFAYYLGIIEDTNATVPIGVYRLNAADVANLDRYEGLGRSYERYLVTVELNGEAVRCFTYLKRDNMPEAPNARYYATCLEGYTDWNMDARRLRHARDFARKNQKVKPYRYQPQHDYETGKGWAGNRFSFDDWYKATFPDRRNGYSKGTGTAADGDSFVPEDTDRAPRTSLVTGRNLPARKPIRPRYEDMRPDEIKAALNMRDPATPAEDRTFFDQSTGLHTFIGRDGQRWVRSNKTGHNVWRRVKEGE